MLMKLVFLLKNKMKNKTINIILSIVLIILGAYMLFNESKKVGALILVFLILSFYVKKKSKKIV